MNEKKLSDTYGGKVTVAQMRSGTVNELECAFGLGFLSLYVFSWNISEHDQ